LRSTVLVRTLGKLGHLEIPVARLRPSLAVALSAFHDPRG
jgi:hypothetical protein